MIAGLKAVLTKIFQITTINKVVVNPVGAHYHLVRVYRVGNVNNFEILNNDFAVNWTTNGQTIHGNFEYNTITEIYINTTNYSKSNVDLTVSGVTGEMYILIYPLV